RSPLMAVLPLPVRTALIPTSPTTSSACAVWRSDALGELTLPKPEAETDGRDDGEFHGAHPRGGNIDLRQVCRDHMSVYRIPLKGLVYRTADHTCDESIHGSLLRGTYIEE